jgi:hypothetical protein
MAEETVTQQIVREAPEIEAYKLKLLQEAQKLAFNQGGGQTLAAQLPNYQVAAFNKAQTDAMQAAADQGIGAFKPYMTAANTALGGAYDTTGEAADILRGADTRNQFTDAQRAMGQAGGAAANITSGIGQINQGLGYLDVAAQRAAASDTTGQFGAARQDLGTGLGALATGQNMAAMSSQANLQPATSTIGRGLEQGQQTLGMGIGAIAGAAQGYDPRAAQSFMDPYRQQVIDETMRQMDRQGAIAGQGLAAQAVKSGAFGGEREGVQRAEMQRNLMDQKASTIANLLSQGYSQAQAQAMQAFEQQQGRQMQAGQGIGQLGAQQAQLGVQAGGQLGNLGVQQAQLGQGAAGQYLQAAQQYGNLASQGGALAGQEASINQNIANLMLQQSQARNQAAQTAAGIYGSQAQQFQGQGQGIGQLAAQQFGIGQQQAQGLGQLAGQLGQLGVQQGALGQTAQALQQGDINFLYNTGQAQQAFNQQTLDAQRATELQKIYAPYQQAGFLSDIYKGAPSTQMSTAVASQPSASPFQQAVGIGLGGLSTAAAVKKAGLFG